MTARRILVTGIAGFVGPHLTTRLVRDGHTVLGLGAEPSPPSLRERLAGEWIADLRDAHAVAEAIAAARPDAVVHLAAQSSAARSFEAPAETFAINVGGTWNVLEAVRAHAPHARVLAVGTGEVYGPQPPGTRTPESTPVHPVSPYALSKAAGEAVCHVVHEAHGLDVVCARAFGHIGPGQTPRFFLPAFAQQIAAIEAGRSESVLKVGNLDVVRDLCDVRDVVDAYALLLERGVAGTDYNVCRSEGVKLSDVVARLVARARVPVRVEPDPARMRPADIAYLVGDPAVIEAACPWKAATPLDRSLDDVLTEWRRPA